MPGSVLDSHALLAFLRGEPDGETTRRLLEKSAEQDAPLHMTEVNYAEVQYIVRRKDGDALWQHIARELPALPITFHPVTRELADVAADFEARFSISLADAFAAALAKTRNTDLVTGDHEFEMLKGEINIHWLDKTSPNLPPVVRESDVTYKIRRKRKTGKRT